MEANARSPLRGLAADLVGGRLPKSVVESWRLIVAGSDFPAKAILAGLADSQS
jgi:hypothetical protein